jgi:glutaredoxin
MPKWQSHSYLPDTAWSFLMTRPVPPVVEVLGKPDCHLCEEAKCLLQALQAIYSFTLREINIATDESLRTQFGEEIPVVFINGRKAFKYRIDVTQFVRRLQRAQAEGQRTWWQGLRRQQDV